MLQTFCNFYINNVISDAFYMDKDILTLFMKEGAVIKMETYKLEIL